MGASANLPPTTERDVLSTTSTVDIFPNGAILHSHNKPAETHEALQATEIITTNSITNPLFAAVGFTIFLAPVVSQLFHASAKFGDDMVEKVFPFDDLTSTSPTTVDSREDMNRCLKVWLSMVLLHSASCPYRMP
jgi:hypothetical protein